MAVEQIRRAVLAQTGITCWFPRWSLPGAAPSHPQCFDAPPQASVPPTAVVESEPLKPATPAATQTPTPALDAMRRLVPTAEPLKPAPVVVEQNQAGNLQPQAVTASTDVSAPFAFSWFALDKRLAVMCMLPSGASRLAGSCRQMLVRLLAALHPSLQNVALSEQSFHWPFAEAPGLPADSAAARQAVDAFVARRLREQNAAMVLVLSDDVPWFFVRDGETSPATGQLIVHPRFGFALFCTHSLHAMELDAGLKREAWQALQLVRDRLARTTGD